MAMTSMFGAVAGSIAYAIVWLLLLRNEWRLLPLGRAISATAGACVFVALGVVSPEDAFAAVNIPTLALLAGCMLVSAHMEAQGLYDRLAHTLSAVGPPLSFLVRVAVVAGVSSALITNDTSCVILTRIVGKACATRKLHPAPYLLALATCANVGSACSPIGNPQNMLIALTSGLTFIQFLIFIAVASVLGMLVTVATIVWRYRVYVLGSSPCPYDWSAEQLAAVMGDAESAQARTDTRTIGTSDALLQASEETVAPDAFQALDIPIEPRDSPRNSNPGIETPTHASPTNGTLAAKSQHAQSGSSRSASSTSEVQSQSTCVQTGGSRQHIATEAASIDVAAAAKPAPTHADVRLGDTEAQQRTPPQPSSPRGATLEIVHGWRRYLILFILAVFPIALLVSDRWIGLSWVSLLTACLLCVVYGKSPAPLIARVDGTLLLFFSGLFIVVDGFNRTGIPEAAWSAVSGSVSMDSPSGLLIFTVIVLIASNVVSNVPLVLLLSPKLLQYTGLQATAAWAELAWVSTVAGNFTLLGSVANLIVAEQAKAWYNLSFMEYLIVGAPSTIMLCAFGVPLVRLCVNIPFAR